MPWHVARSSECPTSKPWAVIKDSDGEVEGCHESREAANKQMAALYANEPEARDMSSTTEDRAEMTARRINDLPDSAFAYIEPGGTKDDEGKTVPRSKRHFPIHDAAHVRNALARAPQSPFGDKAMPKILAAARKFGIKVSQQRSAEPEILLRNDGTLTDVDRKLRLIELIAVPWDQPAEVPWRGDIWTEVFKRGAFDGIESRAGEIRVNREHIKGNTVGKIIDFDSAHPDGLFARVKIVKGPKGDEVLDLAEDDMISPSVGYRAQKPSDVRLDKQSRLREVLNAFLDHLGMVEDPAFKGARVLAVRGEPSGLTAADESPLLATPLLDEFANDPILTWARDRFSS